MTGEGIVLDESFEFSDPRLGTLVTSVHGEVEQRTLEVAESLEAAATELVSLDAVRVL